MAIADTFPKASFGGVQFPYLSLKIVGSLDHHIHKYIHRPGGELETLGRHCYEYHFLCKFDTQSRKWAQLYPLILSELVALCESENTYTLVVPTQGITGVQVKAIKWERNFTAKIRSGEDVEFAFLEDSSAQFTTQQITAVANSDLGSGILACQALALAKGIPTPSIFDKLASAIATFQAALNDIETAAFQVISAISAVLALCESLDQLALFQDPSNFDLYYLFLEVYASAIQISGDVTGANRTVVPWFVPRAMSVTDMSVAVYDGDPSRVADLLSVNNFSDPFNIKAGSVANYILP